MQGNLSGQGYECGRYEGPVLPVEGTAQSVEEGLRGRPGKDSLGRE